MSTWSASSATPGESIPDRIFDLPRHQRPVGAYGDIMGAAARSGHGMSAPDGMIAAIARVNGGRLATRNLTDFATMGLDLIAARLSRCFRQ
jgi:hypothetical protein